MLPTGFYMKKKQSKNPLHELLPFVFKIRQYMIRQLFPFIFRSCHRTDICEVYSCCGCVSVTCSASEGLSARSTRVRFFSRVHSHMVRQMLLLHECRWTVLAFVGFVAPVDHFMSPQTKRRTEALSAGVTGVKLVFFYAEGLSVD